MVNMPLLREQGEFRGSISAFNDLQLAYAATPHLGIMANGFTKSESVTFNDGSQLNGSGFLLEAGAGYFNAFHDLLSAEGYAGIGFGQVTSETVDSNGNGRTFNASGMKLFAQPGLGLSHRIVDFGVATRFAMVKFSNLQTTNYTDTLLAQDGFKDLDKPTFFFFEPALTARVGYQWVKFFAQWGTSLKLNSEALNFRDNYALIGLHITIAPRYLAID
jgi:hypothetical protein